MINRLLFSLSIVSEELLIKNKNKQKIIKALGKFQVDVKRLSLRLGPQYPLTVESYLEKNKQTSK